MTTIRSSFYVPLPDLGMRGPPEDGTKREIPPIRSSGSTNWIDAPKALEEIHPANYCNVAHRALPQNLVTYLPAVEDSLYLETEGDVTRAVNLYLLHPVNIALQAIQGSISCHSEMVHGPTARTDIIWQWTDGTKKVTLGVLELKNTQLLLKADFEQGVADMKPGTESNMDPRSMIRRAFSSEAPNPDERTSLGPSTSRVSRQALKYHHKARTDFIAVFDWCSMIIFDFGGMDEGSLKLAKGTWHQEEPDAPPRATFRMLLLGMLITSLRRTGVIS